MTFTGDGDGGEGDGDGGDAGGEDEGGGGRGHITSTGAADMPSLKH